MLTSADMICPRCASDAGMVVDPPLAVCLQCGLPLHVEFPISIVQPLTVDELDDWPAERLRLLQRLLALRDRAVR